jgi:glyoxylase I family protein
MRWSHVGLNCQDPKLTSEYYTRWFGFEPARAVPVGAEQIVFLRNGEAYLELFPSSASAAPVAGGAGSEAPGLVRHIAFQVENLEATLKDMGDAAEINLGPIDFSEFIPGWRTVWLRDPDGVIVEVSQGYRDEKNEEDHG